MTVKRGPTAARTATIPNNFTDLVALVASHWPLVATGSIGIGGSPYRASKQDCTGCALKARFRQFGERHAQGVG